MREGLHFLGSVCLWVFWGEGMEGSEGSPPWLPCLTTWRPGLPLGSHQTGSGQRGSTGPQAWPVSRRGPTCTLVPSHGGPGLQSSTAQSRAHPASPPWPVAPAHPGWSGGDRAPAVNETNTRRPVDAGRSQNWCSRRPNPDPQPWGEMRPSVGTVRLSRDESALGLTQSTLKSEHTLPQWTCGYLLAARHGKTASSLASRQAMSPRCCRWGLDSRSCSLAVRRGSLARLGAPRGQEWGRPRALGRPP